MFGLVLVMGNRCISPKFFDIVETSGLRLKNVNHNIDKID
jgi:hypothetical protein